MAVLVSGGAGYIGSHTAVKLVKSGYEIVIADNFCNSSEKVTRRIEELCGREIPVEKADFCGAERTAEIFGRYPIDAVIHFAALKSVAESARKPMEYYRNNLLSAINILDAMRNFGVKRFVFSSSATVYGEPKSVPITEDFPLSAVNPYGRTKLMIEDMLRDLYASDGSFNIAVLRYFNPVGAHPSGLIGEEPRGVPNNLVPYIAQVAAGRLRELSVTGNDYPTKDGTGVRDYIHVEDLAEGHIAALRKLESGCGLVTYNLGTGIGYSVLEVAAAYERACGKKIPYKIAPRRPGDIAECYADASLAKRELGWRAERALDEMCRDSWNWQSKNPDGYK